MPFPFESGSRNRRGDRQAECGLSRQGAMCITAHMPKGNSLMPFFASWQWEKASATLAKGHAGWFLGMVLRAVAVGVAAHGNSLNTSADPCPYRRER